jgi:hypothetical protein
MARCTAAGDKRLRPLPATQRRSGSIMMCIWFSSFQAPGMARCTAAGDKRLRPLPATQRRSGSIMICIWFSSFQAPGMARCTAAGDKRLRPLPAAARTTADHRAADRVNLVSTAAYLAQTAASGQAASAHPGWPGGLVTAQTHSSVTQAPQATACSSTENSKLLDT